MRRSIALLSISALLATSTALAQDRVSPPQNPDTGQINRGAGEATPPPTGAPPGAMQQSAPGGQVGDVAAPAAPSTQSNAGGAPASANPGPIGATGQTMPSLFSEENARRDKLPLAQVAFNLSPEQKAALFAGIQDARPGPATDIKPATLIPDEVQLRDIPDAVVEQDRVLKTFKYYRAGDKVVIVSAPNRIAVAIIER